MLGEPNNKYEQLC